MYELEYSGQFKKDLKLMVRRGLNTGIAVSSNQTFNWGEEANHHGH